MLDQHHLLAVTRRGALVLLLVCSLFVSAWAGTISNAAPVATGVSATVSGASTLITIDGTAPMAYSVLRPDARTILIELPGVDATRLARAYSVTSPLVASVTVERAQSADSKPVPRLRIALRAPARDRSQMADNRLVLELSPAVKLNTAPPAAINQRVEIASIGGPPPGAVSEAVARVTPANDPPPAPTPTPLPTRTLPTGTAVQIAPASQNNVAQTEQGKRYGQPGFVGEPINLNVVNADIRDILNYITEQYGVNFVIDSSVGAVPVTVNVTDVPWNIALEAILRANRLGIDVNGNILRIATSNVLATEAATQQQIRDAQLDNSPLVTEFLRLNYARASGTLAQAAGSTGAFSGGSTNLSFSGGAGGDATGGGGDQGLLPIISRRLSRRGSIEVDGRSNTLIITDVKENIDAIRQLVTILDQPEPQVEIETRIVLATRNFSRDLGIQLTARLNSLGGEGGSLATNFTAAAANTVLNLTTGPIGTGLIAASITAAETKGQAKTIATPRVTVLNNRPAQIESGQQIPVQTTQAAGGTAVVTTTFVSAPLRLSVTPQITDVGTVVLRITAENNSLNRAIAVSGVPGIDTQRMQSEVLVPDGGTTVMGGVLGDSESEAQDRTPGLGSLPVIGNLFKRRTTTRTTSELLFFITPRIYRPDYLGRPTAATVSTGTRSVTIPQPVPLGNPPTNTPTPTQLQQQQQQPGGQQNQQNPGQQTPGQQLLNAPIPATPAGTREAPTARPGSLGGARP
ncbi:MAG: type IV pilus secretin PilQ [Pyrinomonadaceae bacterium]